MAKFKKCPRCDINYIPLDKEYCEVCESELSGHAFPELPEDDEESAICPRCGINYLNEGEKMCESCRRELSDKPDGDPSTEDEYDWESDSKEMDLDEEDLMMPDSISLEAMKEEEAEENWDLDEEEGEEDSDLLDDGYPDDLVDVSDLDPLEDDEEPDDEEEDAEASESEEDSEEDPETGSEDAE